MIYCRKRQQLIYYNNLELTVFLQNIKLIFSVVRRNGGKMFTESLSLGQ